jgi:predicted metal-dependent phosphoesterase TrpH
MVLRAALHAHSNWSYDGQWELPRIAGAFAARGYDLLFMTEHDLEFSEERRRAHRDACENASTDRLLIIPGIEYSDPPNIVHILVWGDVPFLGTGKGTQSVLERAAEHGGVCVLAHPSRRAAWQSFRKEWLRYLAGIEVWNRKADGWSPSVEAQRLISQTGALPVVGLDFHCAKQFFPLSVCLNIEGKPDEGKALRALRLGLYNCEAFGVGLKTFTGGIGGNTTRMLESGRRFAARTFRSAFYGS